MGKSRRGYDQISHEKNHFFTIDESVYQYQDLHLYCIFLSCHFVWWKVRQMCTRLTPNTVILKLNNMDILLVHIINSTIINTCKTYFGETYLVLCLRLCMLL